MARQQVGDPVEIGGGEAAFVPVRGDRERLAAVDGRRATSIGRPRASVSTALVDGACQPTRACLPAMYATAAALGLAFAPMADAAAARAAGLEAPCAVRVRGPCGGRRQGEPEPRDGGRRR